MLVYFLIGLNVKTVTQHTRKHFFSRSCRVLTLMMSLCAVTAFANPKAPYRIDQQALTQWYQHRQGNPVWFLDGNISLQGRQALQALSNCSHHGIEKERYRDLLVQVEMLPELSPEEKQNLDYHLTLAMLDYLALLGGERYNLKNLDRKLYLKVKELNEVDLLRKGVKEKQINALLQDLLPKHPQYQALQHLLQRYLEKQRQGGWPTLPHNAKAKLGESHPWIPTLKRQLVTQDAFPQNDYTNAPEFDIPLQAALKRFQTAHGLDPDGVLGPKTLGALNTPVEKRIEQIVFNLERWRWLPQTLGDKYVIVNVPTYQLYGVKGGDIVFESPIIAGKAYRETPVFNAPMTHIILNPSWTVPPSILRDKIALFSKNPALARQRNYRVFNKGGGSVPLGSVNWAAYRGGGFPYILRQTPGAHNALGRIKFHIQNPFMIYLHGTPNPELFKSHKRALSSGCIRVAKPLELGVFVLDDPNWSLKALTAATKGTKTQKVNLTKQLPVYVTYMTVWVRAGGQAHFMPDIYKKDGKVAKFVERGFKK